MWRELLRKNHKDKIIAICWGLIAASGALFVAGFIDIQAVLPTTFLDDQFFGYHTSLLPLFYLVDISLLLFIVRDIQSGSNALWWAALVWFTFNLFENIWDVPVFAYDAHLVVEEVLFVAIYIYLILLLLGNKDTPART